MLMNEMFFEVVFSPLFVLFMLLGLWLGLLEVYPLFPESLIVEDTDT